MSASEMLVRDVATGEGVAYSDFELYCSSINAPWRDLIRVEHGRKTLRGVEMTSLWTTVGVVRAPSAITLRVDDGPLHKMALAPGDVLIWPQGASVYANYDEPLESICIQLSPTVLLTIAEDTGADANLRRDGAVRDEQIEAIASLLEAEITAGCPSGRAYGEHLAFALGAHLIRHYAEPYAAPVATRQRLRNGKLARVLEYIQANVDGDLSLNDLAKTAGLSPFHFSRLFKNSTGLPPHQYVLRWRIEEAKRLLRHTRLDLAEIAARVGFRDQSHFTARFRQITGDTPKRWRGKE